jgi:transposase InsO family protein
VLDRGVEASAPNRKWIADFTYVWTAEGWLYAEAGQAAGAENTRNRCPTVREQQAQH